MDDFPYALAIAGALALLAALAAWLGLPSRKLNWAAPLGIWLGNPIALVAAIALLAGGYTIEFG